LVGVIPSARSSLTSRDRSACRAFAVSRSSSMRVMRARVSSVSSPMQKKRIYPRQISTMTFPCAFRGARRYSHASLYSSIGKTRSTVGAICPESSAR